MKRKLCLCLLALSVLTMAFSSCDGGSTTASSSASSVSSSTTPSEQAGPEDSPDESPGDLDSSEPAGEEPSEDPVSSAEPEVVTVRKPATFELKDCKLIFNNKDFFSKRYTYRLHSEIQKLTGLSLPCYDVAEDPLSGPRIYVKTGKIDGKAVAGNAKIKVTGEDVVCQIDSYLAMESVLNFFRTHFENNQKFVFKSGYTWLGNHTNTLDEITEAARYAFQREGKFRTMFYNVLWRSTGDIPNDKPDERNMLQVETISQYAPDVVGLQECNKTKREISEDRNIVELLKKKGYAELPVTVKNATGVNCTPLFYNTKTVTPITGGYLNFKNQKPDESEQNIASKGLTWGLFEAKSGERFLVVGLHLETRSATVRYNQAKECTKLVNELLKTHNVPVIVGGDFNTTSGSVPFQHFIKEAGYKEALDIARKFASNVRPHHSYPRYYIFPDAMYFNGLFPRADDTVTKELGMGVDHIVVTNDSRLELNVYGVVVDDFTQSASDHFPTFIDFSIKQK